MTEIIKEYDVAGAKTTVGVTSEVNKRLPTMQPIGGLINTPAGFFQPMARFIEGAIALDEQVLSNVAIGDFTGEVTLTVEDDEITEIALPGTAAVVTNTMVIEGVAIEGADPQDVTITVVGGVITKLKLDDPA